MQSPPSTDPNIIQETENVKLLPGFRQVYLWDSCNPVPCDAIVSFEESMEDHFGVPIQFLETYLAEGDYYTLFAVHEDFVHQFGRSQKWNIKAIEDYLRDNDPNTGVFPTRFWNYKSWDLD